MLRHIYCVIKTPKGFYTPKGTFVEEGDSSAVFPNSIDACKAAYKLKSERKVSRAHIHVLPLVYSRGDGRWSLEN